jgi:carboxymethylenebutenolidase
MCDQDHFEDDVKEYTERGLVTRRQFGALAAGAGLSFMLPAVANAQAVTETEVNIKTPDGTCDAYFVHPSSGQHPGVLIWPDIAGLRTSFRAMGKRLAQQGYSVVVVNPFYRSAKAPIAPEGTAFNAIFPIARPMAGALNATTHVTDARAIITWLDAQASVSKTRGMGTMGYCMGGPMVVRTAGTSDRIRGAATFHSGVLVAETPDSPHLVIPNSKASFLIATAENDDKQRPAEKDQLKEIFAKAKLTAEVEVYPAAHGWCPPDSPAYSEPQAERAWTRMIAIFGKALA